MKIEFSSLASLQYITDGPRRYEAVHTAAGVDIYHAGTNERAQLPARAVAEITRRFNEINMQDPETREIYLMESKPCTI